MSLPEWTEKELWLQAQGNGNLSLLLALAFLKEKGLSIEEMSAFFSEKIEPGWGELKGKGALDIARAAAFNPVSLGATLVSLEGDEKQAATVFDWPAIRETANAVGASSEDHITAFRIFHEKISAYLGIGFTFQCEGDRWTFGFSY